MTFDAAKFRFLNMRTSTTGCFSCHSQKTNDTSATAAMIANQRMNDEWNQSSSCPLSRTTSSVPSPSAMSDRPM